MNELDKEILINISSVTKHYQVGEVVIEALKEINLQLNKGELIVILGTSGSGKSTLLNLLGGMDQPTSGTVEINQLDLSKASQRALSRYRSEEVGFVFQFYNLIPDLTAAENISLASSLVKNPANLDEILKQIGMEHRKNQFPSQLSGGEQQRISIGRALVKKPSLLLCDEPTGALDYATGKAILGLLNNICRTSGSTVIIVTHNVAIAQIADRVIKMRSGEITDIIENETPLSVERIDW